MKRGTSGLSLVLPVRKPSGMSSHDVVNRVRRIMGERRVGHAGTLDPMAEGVLPIFVGPATRLDKYVVGHDKSYTADIVFGVATTTDDAEGEILHEGPVPTSVGDWEFAKEFCRGLVGKSKQMPPVYSAIKTNGRKACDEARHGNIVDLAPRDIEVFSAELLEVGNAWRSPDEPDAGVRHDGCPFWRVRFAVSKGTYVRALARDVGTQLRTHAHLGALLREKVGTVELDECYTLEALEEAGLAAAMDPMRLLDMRIAFPAEVAKAKIENGGALRAGEYGLFEQSIGHCREIACCTPTVARSCEPLVDGELVAVILENRLKAIYKYDGTSGMMKPDCVFQIGVSRGVCA